MPTLSLSSAEWEACELTFGQQVAYSAAPLQTLLSSICKMHAVIPITKVEVKISPAPTEYLIVLQDGRRWKQKILDTTLDPPMTFVHADAWKLSEFNLQRPIRDAIVELLHTYELSNLLIKPN